MNASRSTRRTLAVMPTMGDSTPILRSSSVAWCPSITGISLSMKIASNGVAADPPGLLVTSAHARNASNPFDASHASMPSCRTRFTSIFRVGAESSTTSTRGRSPDSFADGEPSRYRYQSRNRFPPPFPSPSPSPSTRARLDPPLAERSCSPELGLSSSRVEGLPSSSSPSPPPSLPRARRDSLEYLSNLLFPSRCADGMNAPGPTRDALLASATNRERVRLRAVSSSSSSAAVASSVGAPSRSLSASASARLSRRISSLVAVLCRRSRVLCLHGRARAAAGRAGVEAKSAAAGLFGAFWGRKGFSHGPAAAGAVPAPRAPSTNRSSIGRVRAGMRMMSTVPRVPSCVRGSPGRED